MSVQDSEQKDYINVKGCVPQFEKWLQDNLTLVAGIFIGVALLQASSIHVFNLHGAPEKTWNKSIITVDFFFMYVNIWSCFFPFHPQIFGICLAQNLVSDIEAVRASWWENDLHHYCVSERICIQFCPFKHTSPDFHLFLWFPFHKIRHFSSLSQYKCWKLYIYELHTLAVHFSRYICTMQTTLPWILLL